MDKTKSLEQLSLRLSYMAEGVDEDADKVLSAIRSRLKDGSDAKKIEDLSGRLARVVMTATGVNVDKSRNIEGGHDLSGLRKLIKELPVRGADQDRIAGIVQQELAGNTGMARQKAVVDLHEVTGGAIDEIAARDKGDSGVLGMLRKKGGDGGDERYVSLYASLVERLAEHIDVLNGNEVRSSSIRDALSGIVHPDRAENLFEEVTQEIERIGEAAKSDDLQKMRTMIDSGMARITERLTRHLEEERQQNEASKERVKELNEQLSSLENEADTLRNEIRSASDLALKDSLTGVYNRAGYEERTTELFARWQRSAAPLSLVFVDCNKFKHINDTYGHAAGDLVLVKVADVLRTRARASDIVCRYGGDEFVVLLPDTKKSGAEVFAKSAFDEVLNAGFNDNGKPLDVSISCGVTELHEGDTMDAAMARADEAMYKAKKMDGIKVYAE